MGFFDYFFNNMQEKVARHGTPLGMGFVGRGEYRIAYRINDNTFGKENKGRVIKFARKEKGREMNQREYEVWNKVKNTEYMQYFCPIREAHPEFKTLIMDYAAKPENPPTKDEAKKLFSNLKNDEKFDIVPRDFRENFGTHPEFENVIIDYPWTKIK